MTNLAALLLVLAPQAPPRIDQARVDAAIEKGVAFLRRGGSPGHDGNVTCDELLLLTFIHAGVPSSDPFLQGLLKKTLAAPLERTYKVSLQAMALEELDRVKHQHRIAQCAQFLADNLCANGQWSYGEPTLFAETVPTGTPVQNEVASGKPRDFTAAAGKPRVTRKIDIQKRREGPASGDNSNSQYAALGMRACHDAGIVFQDGVLRRAEEWWRKSAVPEGKGEGQRRVATGGPTAGGSHGWNYAGEGPYGSMTAGAVGGLAIYDYMLKKPWKKDPAILGGLEWLGRNFTVTANPKTPRGDEAYSAHYYFLYALERAGVLYGTDLIGGRDWYREGAHYLLSQQQPDGCWVSAPDWHREWTTCFAILFLKRATRPLVVTEDKR